MVFHALSEHVKHIRQLHMQNNVLQQAVDAYCAELAKTENEKRKGVQTIADEFGISLQYTTIHNHATGRTVLMLAFNATKQKLLPSEELTMAHFLLESAKHAADTLGKSLDTQRIKALNPPNVKHWFALIKEHIVKKGILPEDIYGMDESGFPLSGSTAARQYGTTLAPMIIYKGQNFMQKWNDNNVAHTLICHSQNRWTDSELCLDWIINDFDPQTKTKADGQTGVLLMDGHSSHFTPKLLEYAMENNISIPGYPPPMLFKALMFEEVAQFHATHRRGVKKTDFTGTFGRSFLRAFTPDLIQSAFCVTGVHPFDPKVITPDQMKPSEETSTHGKFPLSYPTPVCAVLSAFSNYQPTSFELLPSTHTGQTLQQDHQDFLLHREPPVDSPSKRMCLTTGSLSRTSSGSFLASKARMGKGHAIIEPIFQKPAILPAPDWRLLTPSQPSSGSVDGDLFWKTWALHLEESLRRTKQLLSAHKDISAGQNAQIVIQDLTLRKLNKTLNKNNKKKGSDQTKLYPKGNGCHMMERQFVDELRQDQAQRNEKAREKAQRKTNREARKGEGAELEEQWKAIKEQHNAAVKAWEAECKQLEVEGVRKKDWPKKPERALKPKHAQVPSAPQGGENSAEEGRGERLVDKGNVNSEETTDDNE
ncbi:hypothetical protein SERLA73DRAFT_154134 [Serpula lacrymans var. lacrymans S7.3]|uniref:DDE-1 domain-containing protein n=1 Tax=Serpula lacrymans var. lacrymans (strain S7.3) TaxID=936435 RepID=F8Q512_SERL3|nr:hypothetical protein SERLA73DRAFT_154134 [Serpula lacrymans var. lacrymans S7.3]